ncbi:hypothetical protein TNCV_1498861 [Trichonephila clavipes]|nr:hypothetical protein TNCV_1498861 [Trichonephila clavipes]
MRQFPKKRRYPNRRQRYASASSIKTVTEDKAKLYGHNKNFSFLNEDGVQRQSKGMRQFPKKRRYPMRRERYASASSIKMVSEDKTKLYRHNKNISFLNEDGVRRQPSSRKFSRVVGEKEIEVGRPWQPPGFSPSKLGWNRAKSYRRLYVAQS